MKISACVIVKNEEKSIGSWLEAMKPIVDDIVVVDTGSQDRTVEIVASHGIRAEYFAWCQDFAAAKNYAISKAKGDWIVFLDADEYFDQPSSARLRQVLSHYHRSRRVGALLCRLINIDRDNMDRIIDSVLQVRIFRNSPQIRYTGAIHEQLHTDGSYTMQFCKDLQIYHTGYSASLIRQKTERNLPILLQQEREAKTQKERERLYGYLMDAYNFPGHYDKMLEYARLAAKSDIYTMGDATKAYKGMISAMVCLGRSTQEIMAAVDEALEKFPGNTFFLVEKGHFYYHDRSYLKAQQYLEEALESHRQIEGQMAAGQGIIDPALSVLPLLYGELADIYLLRGEAARAEAMAVKGLSCHKYSRLLTRCLYRAVAQQDVVEIIQKFNAIYDKMKDSDYLIDALSELCSPQLAAYYGRQCQDINRLRVFLRTGNYAGAAALAGKGLQLYKHFWQLSQERKQ